MKHQFGDLRIYHEIAGIAHDPVIAVTAVIARDLVIGKAKPTTETGRRSDRIIERLPSMP